MRKTRVKHDGVSVVCTPALAIFMVATLLLAGCSIIENVAPGDDPSSTGAADTTATAGSTLPGLEPSDRTFDYTTEQLDSLVIRKKDLGPDWVLDAEEPEDGITSSDDTTSSDDPFETCMTDAAASIDARLNDAESLYVDGPSLTRENIVFNSSAAAYWSDVEAAAAYQALVSEKGRACLLAYLKSGIIQEVGEEGVLVADASTEVIDGMVPDGYGTVIRNTFTLSDADGSWPAEIVLIIVGKGSVMTFAGVLAGGDYDPSFLMTPVAKMVSRVESLTPGGALITR